MTTRHVLAIGLVLPLLSCSPPAAEDPSPEAQPETVPVAAPAPVAETTKPEPKLTSIQPAEPIGPNRVDIDQIFKQAEQAIKARDLDEALKKTDEVLAADPKHRAALFLQAAILQDKAQLARSPQQAERRNELFLKSGAVARRLRDAHPNQNARERAMLATWFYNEGCALAMARETDKALASINDAVDFGFPQLQLLETDPDLASVRDKPAFRDLQKRAANLVKTRNRSTAKQMLAEQKPFTFNRPDASSNKIVSSASFKGKVVLVDLWATWCPPCREEVKVLVKLQKAYQKAGLEVVGINFEGTPFKEAKETVRRFVKENRINYTCLLGDEKTRDQVPHFTAYPTLVFLDRAGRVRLQRLGLHTYEALEAIVTTLLEEPGTSVARK